MSLLINAQGQLLADNYQRVADDAPLPATGPVLVGLAQLDAAFAQGGSVGLSLANTVAVASLSEQLARLALIELNFPAFSDGRGYSQAQLLRRMGFNGPLRASGPAVAADQLLMMRRCGITEFLLHTPATLITVQQLLAKAAVQPYQPDLLNNSGALFAH